MSLRAEMWDVNNLVKIFAWVYIVFNIIFSLLLVLAIVILTQQFGRNEIFGDSVSGLSGVDTAGISLFVILLFLIFLCFIGIDIGIIAMRQGMDALLEGDRLLKGWITQSLTFLVLLIIGAPIAAFFQYSLITRQ